MKHVKIRVHGTVQGVFFRKFTQERALSFGLVGYVENHSNGTVYIEAEGDEKGIEAFYQWCHQGSPKSKVTHLELEEGQVNDFKGFEIRR